MATRKPNDKSPTGRKAADTPSRKPSQPVTKQLGRAVASAGRQMASPAGSSKGKVARAVGATVSGEGGSRPTATRAPGQDNRVAVDGMERPPVPMPEGGTLAHSTALAAPAMPQLGALAAKLDGQHALAEKLPANSNKPTEYGQAALSPQEGEHAAPGDTSVTGSTLTETAVSPKVGEGEPPVGDNPNNGPLDRYRADSTGMTLTTNQGVAVADNQNSLKAGLRGPTLLEDFILREKITHFDHERIPERVVHARGSGAHGYFECYQPLTDLTRAAVFSEAGKRTPVFVRFSTVLGERGSADTVRDVRGFAVKFYTEEGNWDLVGNNIPVFFIQDAMKFPDVVHAGKPEPHHQIPQASTAHDTFWDFISLSPESAHMIMWVMSDRGVPRSYRTMQGFGVHTFRFVNAQGESKFVKFHWNPIAGTHSLDWDEAVKLAGMDADYHRRDLWEAIETGNFPEYELGIQVFTEEQAEAWSFDVLDSTKIVPEELVPVVPVGRMVLDRNPDNFFAETEQVAFCTQHIVPGLDFTNDPLLHGRNHSYLDTQLTRLGGPNFHEIPINASVAQVHNNQRDGFHRTTINRGRVNYEPNSLAGGCPFQAGMMGFTSAASSRNATSGLSGTAAALAVGVGVDRVRGKPERFAEHYAQARLFYRSQTKVEQDHIARALRFELSRVQTAAVRERVLAMLLNIDQTLAERVAEALGMDLPAPLPLAAPIPEQVEVERSMALSLFARPGDGSIRGRKVAILAADGVDVTGLVAARDALLQAGAVPRVIGIRFGQVTGTDGNKLVVDTVMEAMPPELFDALMIPDGQEGIQALARLGMAREFARCQFRHSKPILAMGAGVGLLEATGLPLALPDGCADPGLVFGEGERAQEALETFATAIARHRHWERETDPAAV